jgi:hypothetical protein
MGAKFDDSRTKDHLIPKSKGGTHHKENLVPACERCNNTRKSKSVTGWYYRCVREGLEPDSDLLIAKLTAYCEVSGIPESVRVTAQHQLKGLTGMVTSL